MTKRTITRIWLVGFIGLAAGLLVGGLGIGLMLGFGGTYTLAPSGSGYDFAPRIDGFFWAMVSLMIVGLAVAAAGGIAQLAAWIGALVNTYQLQDKTWFVVLLVGGLLGLTVGLIGFATMVAYLVAGPDGQTIRSLRETPLAPPLAEEARTLVPTH